jgi:thymidylate kinase
MPEPTHTNAVVEWIVGWGATLVALVPFLFQTVRTKAKDILTWTINKFFKPSEFNPTVCALLHKQVDERMERIEGGFEANKVFYLNQTREQRDYFANNLEAVRDISQRQLEAVIPMNEKIGELTSQIDGLPDKIIVKLLENGHLK